MSVYESSLGAASSTGGSACGAPAAKAPPPAKSSGGGGSGGFGSCNAGAVSSLIPDADLRAVVAVGRGSDVMNTTSSESPLGCRDEPDEPDDRENQLRFREN